MAGVDWLVSNIGCLYNSLSNMQNVNILTQVFFLSKLKLESFKITQLWKWRQLLSKQWKHLSKFLNIFISDCHHKGAIKWLVSSNSSPNGDLVAITDKSSKTVCLEVLLFYWTVPYSGLFYKFYLHLHPPPVIWGIVKFKLWSLYLKFTDKNKRRDPWSQDSNILQVCFLTPVEHKSWNL